MTLKDLFPAQEIFDPDIYFNSSIQFGESSFDVKKNELVLNALQNKKSNAFLDYLEKYYYPDMRQLFNKNSMDLDFSVIVRLSHNAKTDKRGLTFSYINYLEEKVASNKFNGVDCSTFTQAIINNHSDEEIINTAREIFIETRKRLRDILNKGMNSIYFKDLLPDLKNYNINYQNKKILDVYLNKGIEIITNFLNISKLKLLSFFERQLNLEEFLACFSYDKLCVVVMYEFLQSLIYDQIDINLLRVILKYTAALKELRKIDKSYNPSAVVNAWGKDKIILITADDILEGLDLFFKNNPDVTVPDLNKEKIAKILKNFGYREQEIQSFNPKLKKDADKLNNLLVRMQEEEILFAKWEFLPKGEKEEVINKNSYLNKKGTIETQEYLRRFRIVRNYIEGSNYLKKVQGKDTFQGYMAYIYPNSKVLLMRDYAQIKTRAEMESSAMYVMNLQNFLTLSKLSKEELIKLINVAPQYGLKRVLHYKNMETTINILEMAITGDDYTEEVQLFINRLINSGDLQRKRQC